LARPAFHVRSNRPSARIDASRNPAFFTAAAT
jgi:hypothetical protein